MQMLDLSEQMLAARRREQREVEFLVAAHVLRRITFLERRKQRVARDAQGRRRMRRQRMFQCKTFEYRTHLVDLARFVRVEARDDGALVHFRTDPALAFEAFERFADRNVAHREMACEVVLTQRLARQQLALHDRVADFVGDRLRRTDALDQRIVHSSDSHVHLYMIYKMPQQRIALHR